MSLLRSHLIHHPIEEKHRTDDKQHEDQQGDSDDQQRDFKGLVHSLTSVAIFNYNLGSGNFLHEKSRGPAQVCGSYRKGYF